MMKEERGEGKREIYERKEGERGRMMIWRDGELKG